MRYLSVCSGIEAATCAWHSLGWTPVAFSEIEKFPCAVLAQHYPAVPNWGDMTKFKEWPDATVDVLVGGTPCQSFSVAGLRKGLADPRGNLMLTYLAIAARYRPRWLVWENVPGVLSSGGGRDFASLLRGLAELGYGFAYRVLDAQHFGVPQRRRRVFVVGHLGSWQRAAAVLFERHSLSGHPAPSREARKGVAAGSGQSFGIRSANTSSNGWGISEEVTHTLDQAQPHAVLAHSLRADGFDGFDGSEDGTGRGTPLVPIFSLQGGGRTSQGSQGSGWNEDKSFTLNSTDVHAVAQFWDGSDTTPSLDASNASKQQAMPEKGRFMAVIEPLPFDRTQVTSKTNRSNPKTDDPCHPLAAHAHAHAPAIAFDCKRNASDSAASEVSPTLRSMGHSNAGGQVAVAFESRLARNGRGAPSEVVPPLKAQSGESGESGKGDAAPLLMSGSAVRRLTPRECERLQGFADDYTLVPFRGKPAADGPRYKALGNSMAVPCMRWLGERIQMVENVS